MGLKKSRSGKNRNKSWVENMKKKGTYNDYLKQKKDVMAEKGEKMRNVII